MGGHGERLTRKQEQAVAALLAHGTLGEAAAAAGMSVSGLRKWLRHPPFKAAFLDAKRAVLTAAIAKLQGVTAKAVARLEANLDAADPAVSTRAATAVLTLALKSHEVLDLVAVVEELQARLEQFEAGGRPGDAHEPA